MARNVNARGAVIERSLVTRWLRRKLDQKASKYDGYPHSWRLLATDLVVWLQHQPVRTKKPGGIGRG